MSTFRFDYINVVPKILGTEITVGIVKLDDVYKKRSFKNSY